MYNDIIYYILEPFPSDIAEGKIMNINKSGI
jgi:hypothetical protein